MAGMKAKIKQLEKELKAKSERCDGYYWDHRREKENSSNVAAEAKAEVIARFEAALTILPEENSFLHRNSNDENIETRTNSSLRQIAAMIKNLHYAHGRVGVYEKLFGPETKAELPRDGVAPYPPPFS